MACHFCLGFCAAATPRRLSVSLFDGEDPEIDQAVQRSKELPDSRVAEELRAFFIIEAEHAHLVNYIQNLAGSETTRVEYELLNQHEFVTTRPLLAVASLRRHGELALEFKDIVAAIEFELKVRKEKNLRQFQPLMAANYYTVFMERALPAYQELCSAFSTLISSRKSYSTAASAHVGELAVAMLDSCGALPHQYIQALSFLHSINEKETISVWTSRTHYRELPSG